MKPKVTEKQARNALIAELLAEGVLTYEEVGQRVGLTSAGVSWVAKKLGLGRGRGRPPPGLDRVTPFDKRWKKDERDCWVWVFAISSRGYGVHTPGRGRTVAAHRFSFRRSIGPIPSGYHVHHRCGNRRCVNPGHLEAISPYAHLKEHDSISERNRRKTHCKRGHAFTDANTYRTSNGGRECYACKRMRWRGEL